MNFIKPKHDWLLIKREKDVERKQGSLFIPAQYKPRFFVWGLVDAVGPGQPTPKREGNRHSMTVKEGDRILYPKGAIKTELSQEFDHYTDNYDMVDERSVVAFYRDGKLVPMFSHVIGKVVKEQSTEKVTESGLILLGSTAIKNKREATDMAKVEVVSVGPGRRTESGTYIPNAAPAGTICLVNAWDAFEFALMPDDPDNYVIVRDEEILATLD